MAETKPPRKPLRAQGSPLQRAVRLLARRDLSRAELAARLGRQGRNEADVAADLDMPGGEVPVEAPDGVQPAGAIATTTLGAAAATAAVDAVLDRLQGLGLQSDQRVAENHVRSRQARSGSRRLAAELRQRGIDGETIDAALGSLADTELQRARALWARRFELTRDPRERARQMRFLAARGFGMAVIRAVVGGCTADDDLPPDAVDDSAG